MTIDRGTRSFWLLQLGGWSFYGLATFLTFLTSAQPDQWWALFQFKGIARPVAGIAVSSLLALVYRGLDEARGGAVAVAAAAGSVAGGVAWYAASRLVLAAVRPGGDVLLWPAEPHVLLEYVFVMAAWSAAFLWVVAWRRSRARERRVREAETRVTEARLRMLASQLEPHFLFNALSSLRGLIRRDPERAEHTVTRLAAFLRVAVVQPTLREVTLEEELDVARAYLDVERARLGDVLDVSVDVEPAALDARLPAFLLYPLVENAVKHGTSPRVDIRGRLEDGRLRLAVTNPGTLAETTGPEERGGAGVGLENLRARLRHTHPGRHSFSLVEEDGRVEARIELDTSQEEGARDDGEEHA